MLDGNRSKVLIASTAVLAMMAAGCGRTQSALNPRVDIGQVTDGQVGGDEQSANDRIDAELRKQKSDLAEKSETLLASAETQARSWKDRLTPGKKSAVSAADFGDDPFLAGLDEMIDKQESRLQQTAGQVQEELSQSEAAELFGEVKTQATNALESLDTAATEAVAASDVFGSTASEIFGDEPDSSPRSAHHVARDQSVAQSPKGPIVHRFDDLFDQAEAQVQRVASHTRDSVRDTAQDTLQDVFDALPSPTEPSRLKVEPPPVEPQPVAVQVPEAPDFEATVEHMFDPPPMEEAPVVAEIETPAFPEIPAFADEPMEVAQKDAVVTPNAPASLPAPAGLSDNDFAAMEREAIDPYEHPSFGATDFSEPRPALPSVEDIPEVQIPQEPAPRFATEEIAQQRTMAQVVQTQNVASIPVVPTPPVTSAPLSVPTAAAAVLPDVNWQQKPGTTRTLRAPSEWTAWFLMGGAALIVLLLFAPSRRQ